MLNESSRYYDIETAKWQTTSNQTIVYLRRRFLPSPQRFEVLQEHQVSEGDRLDNITANYLHDPELFWHLCDANNTMHPNELTAQIGRLLRIPLL
ncbi:LysM domain-containing protein [Nostocaceae cyanobacterium CENA369]|uniref:LysM domain-containing protein n=1 Tax=Dendronalium phyllosphericum CENA369 TaxID=1725256 RepID=A0A8J7IDQ3_9NOST|nr:LysM domain-containing protein [Dendronalium phyllosphericum]MBH8578155.1 LysM domain-containing protein [Dendronalium phyllosphericum CENA369]